METPDQVPAPYPGEPQPGRQAGYPRTAGLWALGERLTWLAGLILALSAFMGWYTGSGDGLTIAVIGWHTGTLGKLVFFVGLAVLALVVLREAGIELPPPCPRASS